MTDGAGFEKAWEIVKNEPIEYDGACPHCGANASELAGIEAVEELEHDLIDYGLDGDYYQTYQCFNCSGQWENRYSFSGVVKR